MDLWQEVQTTITRITGTKQKCTGIKGAFPLSGILQYEDGTPFHGSSSWGRTSRVSYYFNAKNKVRLSSDAIHEETRQKISQIIEKDPSLKDAIKARAEQANITLQLISQEMEQVKAMKATLDDERRSLDRRLDFLLGGDSTPAVLMPFGKITCAGSLKLTRSWRNIIGST